MVTWTQNAFTLVELLVVMAIIGILASLLLLAVSRAKPAACSIACKNNLHQISLASFAYASDYDRFPSIIEWLYAKSAINTNTTPSPTTGQLFLYLGTTNAYRCILDRRQGADHSYAMNCYMCHARNLAACLSPSQSCFFIESQMPQANRIASGLAPNVQPIVGPAIPLRHRGRAYALLVDGHVRELTARDLDESWRTRDFWFPTQRGGYGGP